MKLLTKNLRILHDIKCDSQIPGILSDCDGWSPIAWQDLREISGWPLVVRVDNVSNVHLDHVNMLLIAPACVPVLYVLLCKAESIDVSDCTQTFPLWLPTSIQWSIQSLWEGFVCCAKSPSLFSGVHRAGRRGGVNICNPVQRRQCLATPCLGLPLGQADWGISRLRQRLLTET